MWHDDAMLKVQHLSPYLSILLAVVLEEIHEVTMALVPQSLAQEITTL